MLSKLTRIGLIVIVIALLVGNPAVGINASPVSGIGSISAGPAQNAPGTPAPTYLFVLDNFNADSTRSHDTDTDYVGFAVSVNNQIVGVTHKYVGDVGGNTFKPIDLEIGPVPIPNRSGYGYYGYQPTPVVISYLIINRGSVADESPSTIYGNIDDATKYLLNSYVPGSGSPLAFVDNYLGYLYTSRCDGAVAAAKITINGGDIPLPATIGTSIPEQQNVNYGTDSPLGCGGNSQYKMNWHVKRIS